MDSDPVSQSTQLLQHALAPSSQSQAHHRDSDSESGLASPTDGNLTAIDFSLDSRVVPARPVTPRYHLQISSLRNPGPERSGEYVLGEEEKFGQENGERVGACCIAPSSKNNVDPTQLGSGSEFFRQHGDSPVTASAGKAIRTRTVSFYSPTTDHPAKSMPVANRQYTRSPSPLSQDSFGGPVSQDPAELYLASAKQFNVPLSDLGETPTQEVIHSPTDPAITLPDASEHKEFLEAAMRKYEAQRANRATSIRRPNILVAATPSNSDESLGPSQRRDEVFSSHNRGPEFTGQESRFEFDGSSSFDKMLDRDLTDIPDPTPEPTQAKETHPTQVDGIADAKPSAAADILTIPPRGGEQCPPPFEWIAPSPSAAVSSSNPRSLLRMVHPYRIAKMHNSAQPPSCVTVGAETQPSRMEETHFCHVDERASSDALVPARSTVRQTKAARSRRLVHQTLKENEEDEPEDALDVVPDSEPLRAGAGIQTPTHHCIVRQVSPKKLFRPCSPMSEHGSGDIMPESLEAEESEADVPLALEVVSRDTKRYGVPTEDVAILGRKTKPTSAVPTKAPYPALEIQSQKPSSSSTNGVNYRAKSSKAEPLEIPTSLPDQDLHGQTPSSGRFPSPSTNLTSSKKNRKRLDNLQSSRARDISTTRLPAAKPVTGQKRSHKSDTESTEDWSFHPTEDEGAVHPKAQKEEEEETESADDHDADLPPPPKPGASRKKRKRMGDDNLTRASKASTSTLIRNKRSETPAVVTRSVKRLRSGVSSTRGLTVEPPTRVFALWKQDGHYYSGLVHSRAMKNRYLVRFDDRTEDEVELKNMRYRELRADDRVISTQDGSKGVVRDTSHADSHGWVVLDIDDGKAISTRRATFRDIRIANRTIQSQWKDRVVVPENLVTQVKPKAPLDATPSKQSVISMTSGNAQRVLVRTGFVVTINPKNEEPIQTKEEGMHAIRLHGGEVFDDWSCLFTMEGKHSHSNKRWVATPQDFCLKSGVNLDRVFLLSDDAHQKPKFLLALALGIPCLSFEWLTKEGEFSSDWQPFLLPAGYSDTLGARVSQLVDLDWGNCTEHLTDIMANRVPTKLLLQKTVLCIGADLVPLPPNRTRKNALEEASRYVPWIILCMGAAKVEAVTDTKQVTPSRMESFDYIIVKDRDILGSIEVGNSVVVGDVNWVKECLVSSRLSTPELE